MQDAIVIQGIEARYAALAPLLDERMRRQWAAAEAQAYGWGGVRAVSRAIGMSPNTIVKGLAELAARREDPGTPLEARLRAEGGGRLRVDRRRPGTGRGLGTVGESRDPWRSHVAAAVDLQEHFSTGHGIDAARTSCQPEHGGAIAEGRWLQPPE